MGAVGVVVSRAATASTTWSGARALRPRGPKPISSGTTSARWPATTPWSYPAGSPTATTCGRGRSPASRRSWRRWPSSPPTAGPVVGICNGFQVLTEAGLLPGALQKNRGLRFSVHDGRGDGEHHPHRAHQRRRWPGRALALPINHFEGNFTCDAATLEQLRAEDRIVLRYYRQPQRVGRRHRRRVQRGRQRRGLMPHPERACDAMTGGTDGMGLLESLVVAATRRPHVPV